MSEFICLLRLVGVNIAKTCKNNMKDSPESCLKLDHDLLHFLPTYRYTPPKTNMTIQKQPFEDVFPIQKGVFFFFHVNFRGCAVFNHPPLSQPQAPDVDFNRVIATQLRPVPCH